MKKLCLPLAVFACVSQLAHAAIVVYEGKDAGVGPGGLLPNSDAAAASFDTAAGAFGAISLIDFEGVSTGNFSSRSIFPGVTASQTGYDTSYTNGGISQDTSAPTTLGYNTTSGGNTFWRFVPEFDVGSADAIYTFITPIQAFGLYLTGLGTASGDLSIEFTDGASHSLQITGSSSGGAQFFGFTDAGKAISSVTLALNNVSGSRDIFSMDDVRIVSIPEPSSMAAIGVVTISGVFIRKRFAL